MFADVDSDFEYLTRPRDSLFLALDVLKSVEGFSLQTSEIVEYLVPYLKLESLQTSEWGLTSSKMLHEVKQYLSRHFQEAEVLAAMSQLAQAAYQEGVIDHIECSWNALDREETVALVDQLQDYIDTIYISETQQGIKQVKEILNAMIKRLREASDLFHFTATTTGSLLLLNGVDSVISAILSLKGLLP